MSSCKEILKELEYYTMVEDGLEAKKDANRKDYNFKKIMDDLKQKRNDEVVAKRYNANIEKAKELVSTYIIVHNTTLESVIGIIQNGSLLSIDEMEKRDISFNFRISQRGINDEMHKYVFGATHKGEPIYGLYEIRFKKAVETTNSLFTPMSFLEYGAEVFKDYIMDIKYWRAYLAEYIATYFDEPGNYLKETPLHLRPEFLFLDKVELEDIEYILCASEKAASEVVKRIKREFGEDSQFIKLIKVAGE